MITQSYSPNYYYSNQTVSADIIRKAGCFFWFGDKRYFLTHGQSFSYKSSATSGQGFKYSCDDNKLIHQGPLALTNVNFDCQVSGNNNGCNRLVSCPAGKQLVGIKAACNLEFGNVSASYLSSLGFDNLGVEKSSDDKSDGRCSISANASTKTISSGKISVSSLLGLTQDALVSCKEHDENGGDCQIKGTALCL